jgi:MerR family transcriptional regulator, thiopeptide resistance regulator
MEWSIHDVARLSGTTSRALRHYGDIGLLSPSRIGANGYRFYDEDALARLQRILLLKELGLGLPAIADVLEGETAHADALGTHLQWLHKERERLDRQIAAVERTIGTLQEGGQLVAEQMFDGFDHTRYKEEVEQRWGKDAYATSDAWWRGMSDAQKKDWMLRQQQLGTDWIQAAAAGTDPGSTAAQALAQRQFDWLRGIPGTPGGGGSGPTKEYFIGLAELYVADERFAANYGGPQGASFVRDTMKVYADRNL